MRFSSLPFRVLSLVALLVFLVPATVVAEEAATGEAGAAEAPAQEPAEIVGDAEEGKRLLARAEAYWTARIGQDPAVLGYYPPEDLRPEGMKGVPAEGGTIGWTKYHIEAVKADGDVGLVQVRTHMKLPPDQASRFPESMKRFLAPTVMEHWVRLEGEWYKRPVEMGLSRIMKNQRAQNEAARKQAEAKAKAEAEAPKAPAP